MISDLFQKTFWSERLASDEYIRDQRRQLISKDIFKGDIAESNARMARCTSAYKLLVRKCFKIREPCLDSQDEGFDRRLAGVNCPFREFGQRIQIHDRSTHNRRTFSSHRCWLQSLKWPYRHEVLNMKNPWFFHDCQWIWEWKVYACPGSH